MGGDSKMRDILAILNEIAEAKGTKDKKEVIRKYSGNSLFKKIVQYALDQDATYHLTTLPETTEVSSESVFDLLSQLNVRRGCTEAMALDLASRCHGEADREIVTRIINKDLRCGARAALFNSVEKGWVYEVPYQRYKSSSTIDKIDFSEQVVCQLKMDGMFAYLFTGNRVQPFLTRNGSRFSLGKDFQIRLENSWIYKVNKAIDDETVRMGELLVLGPDGKFLPRKEGNGILNSFIAGKGDPAMVDKIRYVTWGWVSQHDFNRKESDTLYTTIMRYDNSAYKDVGPGDVVLLSKSKEIGSVEEAQEFFLSARERKEEGAIVKVASKLKWRDQRSGTPYGVKLKAEFEGDFEIISAYPGKTGRKYENMLGGIRVRSSCGLIESNIGGGFSDEDREKGVDWWNNRKGMIISAKFTGLITDKTDRKTWCFDHGRFIETRFNEKTEADSYEDILEIMGEK